MSEGNMTEGKEELTALHQKIADHAKNKTPLYLNETEVGVLEDALTVRYNAIDLFNRLRCAVPEMPGASATDDEQKEIEKIRVVLEEYKKHLHQKPEELKLTAKQVDVSLKSISTKASKSNFDDKEKEPG